MTTPSLHSTMSASEIISYINAYNVENPNGLTLSQMQDLASRVDVSDATDSVLSILYTGEVGASSAEDIALGLANQHTDVGIINNTDADTLFRSQVFRNALEDAVDNYNINKK